MTTTEDLVARTDVSFYPSIYLSHHASIYPDSKPADARHYQHGTLRLQRMSIHPPNLSPNERLATALKCPDFQHSQLRIHRSQAVCTVIFSESYHEAQNDLYPTIQAALT